MGCDLQRRIGRVRVSAVQGQAARICASLCADPPEHVIAFCDEHNVDVAVDDELMPGRVRSPRLLSDETP